MPKDRKPAPKKRKLVITFDDKIRSDYITGFHKRKQQRRFKAQEDIAKKLKQKVREERNKRRKAVKKKTHDILAGLDEMDEPNGVEKTEDGENTEKLEFEDHEVFVKTDFNFEDAGFMAANTEDDKDAEISSVENPVKEKQKRKVKPGSTKKTKTKQKR